MDNNQNTPQEIQTNAPKTGQAQQPLQPPMPPSEIVTPEKKSKKKTIIVVLALVLMLAILAGVAFMLLSGDEEPVDTADSQNKSQLPESAVDTQPQGPFDIDIHVTALHNGLLTEFSDSISTDLSIRAYSDGSTGSVVMYDETNDILVGVDSPENAFSYTEYSKDKGGSEAPYTFAVNYLEQTGLSETTLTGDLADFISASNTPNITLRDDDSTCRIYQDQWSPELKINCVLNGSVQTEVEKVLPFYEAYTLQIDTETPFVVGVSEITENADFPGYEKAAGGIGYGDSGAVLIWYRVAGGTWIFSHGGHDAPVCDEIADIDQQKALSDSGCYGDNDEYTTVEDFYSL